MHILTYMHSAERSGPMEEKETLRQAKQEAEARANQMASIFEAMADGVVVYDCDGRIQYTNTAFRALFALNTDALHCYHMMSRQ